MNDNIKSIIKNTKESVRNIKSKVEQAGIEIKEILSNKIVKSLLGILAVAATNTTGFYGDASYKHSAKNELHNIKAFETTLTSTKPVNPMEKLNPFAWDSFDNVEEFMLASLNNGHVDHKGVKSGIGNNLNAEKRVAIAKLTQEYYQAFRGAGQSVDLAFYGAAGIAYEKETGVKQENLTFLMQNWKIAVNNPGMTAEDIQKSIEKSHKVDEK